MKKKIRKKNNFGINFIGPIGQPYLVISYFNPAIHHMSLLNI